MCGRTAECAREPRQAKQIAATAAKGRMRHWQARHLFSASMPHHARPYAAFLNGSSVCLSITAQKPQHDRLGPASAPVVSGFPQSAPCQATRGHLEGPVQAVAVFTHACCAHRRG